MSEESYKMVKMIAKLDTAVFQLNYRSSGRSFPAITRSVKLVYARISKLESELGKLDSTKKANAILAFHALASVRAARSLCEEISSALRMFFEVVKDEPR